MHVKAKAPFYKRENVKHVTERHFILICLQ